MNVKKDLKSKIEGGYMYFTFLFDIMGQSASLNKLGNAYENYVTRSNNPTSKETTDAKNIFLDLTQDTISTSKIIVNIKDIINKISNYLKSDEDAKNIVKSIFDKAKDLDKANINEEEETRYLNNTIKEIDLKCQQFSDTFLIYFKLPSFAEKDFEDKYTVLIGILDLILEHLSYMTIELLAKKIAIRGAASIGMGWELGENNFYGPVLSEVHYLESKIAKYPRIIISKKALNFLHAIKKNIIQNSESFDESFKRVLGFFIKDYDGIYTLDYLSKNTIEHIERQNSRLKLNEVINAYNFVFTTYDKFYKKASFDTQKLTSYYKDLTHYFLDKLEHSKEWKPLLSPIKNKEGSTIGFKEIEKEKI